MGHKTKGLRKNFYRDRQHEDYRECDGILDQAKEYANLAYLVGILGAIPKYVQRMEKIVKSNAYVRSVLEHHPEPILAMSGRFCGDPDRDSGEDLDRGSLQFGTRRDAGSWGSLATEVTGGVFHIAA